jgi:hypothetical protein
MQQLRLFIQWRRRGVKGGGGLALLASLTGPTGLTGPTSYPVRFAISSHTAAANSLHDNGVTLGR